MSDKKMKISLSVNRTRSLDISPHPTVPWFDLFLTHFGSHLKRWLIQGHKVHPKPQNRQSSKAAKWSSSQHPDFAKGIAAYPLLI